uniref:TSA: Wollemia nobilis Ref_Wollemi_Transcript_25448_1281 transcribed RNA sequence n=1 Tax=Wollemia nobilis TaxID=56998 RepID=A0A0C9RQC7_9CONI
MVGYVVKESQKPAWLEALLSESFFVPCLTHESAKKNERNIFCLDCCRSICPHCLSVHRSHRLLQVRRYVYHDVIRLDDMEKLIDCSYVQAYTTNSAKVVFLNQRPQSRPFKGSGNICCTCERSLQEPYHFCSLGCKVDHIINQGRDLSKYLFECHYLALSDFVFAKDYEDGQMTPNSTLDNSMALRTSSGSSGSEEEMGYNKTLGCTEFVKKKRSVFKSSATNTDMAAESSFNRRKGTPHRSPFF